MKFALNGALTIGTLDGANIEIRNEVGAANFFAFGKTIEEIKALRAAGGYSPWDLYHADADLRRILDYLDSDFLNLEQPGLFRPVRQALLDHGDYYLHLLDFRSYVECQEEVDRTFRDPERWTAMALANIANMGRFSSDRTIQEYAREVWDLKPCPIKLEPVPSATVPV
jgi:starch phosphorylase